MTNRFRMTLAGSFAALGLSVSACDVLLFPELESDLDTSSLSFSERAQTSSRWMNDWQPGNLEPLHGRVAGQFELVSWPVPRVAEEPEASIEGRVLRLELVAGAPRENWGMAVVSIWLPPRASLVPGESVAIPAEDVRFLACAGDSPGMWEREERANRAGATIRVDELDPTLLHVDFDAGFASSSRARMEGSLTARLPSNRLVVR